MGLLADHTRWIFLLPASPEAEERHVYDVAYGVFCLENKGIGSENIAVIIDGDKKRIAALLQIASANQYQIYNSSDIYAILQNNTYDNMDSYKCAGLNTNDLYKKVKLNDNIRTRNITFEIDALILKCQTMDRSSHEYRIAQLQLKAAQKIYEDSLNIRFNHQEPWILNATLAQEMEF